MAIENKPGAAPQPGQPNQPPPQPKPAAAQPAGQDNSGRSSEPGEGLADALQAQFKARTEVPGHPGIDARLDNRQGRFRPPVERWPAKPQQVDGPDLAGQLDHTRQTLRDLTDVGDTKGMYSPGPHGLSGEALRQGDTAYGPEGLSTGDVASGSKD